METLILSFWIMRPPHRSITLGPSLASTPEMINNEEDLGETETSLEVEAEEETTSEMIDEPEETDTETAAFLVPHLPSVGDQSKGDPVSREDHFPERGPRHPVAQTSGDHHLPSIVVALTRIVHRSEELLHLLAVLLADLIVLLVAPHSDREDSNKEASAETISTMTVKIVTMMK